MTNVDVHDRNDRRSALDAFAAAGTVGATQVAAPSVQPLASPADRVFGAQQVAVYRDEARILQKLAALGAAAGTEWLYRFPVRKKIKNEDTGRDEWVQDWIEGPTIKLANDVARIYGNCEVDTRVIDLGPTWLIYARFTDYETGYALTRPFQQNKSASKMGGEDNARRLDIAFQIGVSKAIRNVVVNALQTFSDHAFEAAKNSLVERIGKDLEAWRNRTLAGLANVPVELDRVERVLGRPAKDWLAPHIAQVIAMMKAIADGMATVDETFPPRQSGGDQDKNSPAAAETAAPLTTAADGGAETAGGRKPRAPGSESAAGGSATNQSSTQGAEQQVSRTHAAASGKAAPEDETSPKGTPSSKGAAAASDFTPTTEAQYEAFANAWIDAVVDAAEAEARWKSEKGIRNKANVSEEVREGLKKKLDGRIAEIKDADRS